MISGVICYREHALIPVAKRRWKGTEVPKVEQTAVLSLICMIVSVWNKHLFCPTNHEVKESLVDLRRLRYVVIRYDS
jgi:hypothetical protein